MAKPKKELASKREAAMAIVKEHAVKNSSKLDRKSLFHELLYNTEMDRSAVEFEVAMRCYDHEFPNDEDLNKGEFERIYKSVKKSVANFCSKSHRESTAKATYNYDPAYGKFELINDKAARTLKIIDREVSEA